jgi:hypothetical protein
VGTRHVLSGTRYFVAALFLLCPAAIGAATVDLDFDSLPSAQGWLYQGHIPESAAFSVDGNTLTLDTLGRGAVLSTYGIGNIIDPDLPFIVSVRARVLEQEGTPGSLPFHFGSFTGKETFQVGLGVAEVRVQGRRIGLDGSRFHDFRLEAVPGTGSSFFVDGQLVDSFPPHPTDVTGNSIFFGDGSAFDDSNGLVEIQRYLFLQDVDLVCPPDRSIVGCNMRALGRLPFSESEVPITPGRFRAEGGDAAPACGVARFTYRDSSSETCPKLVVRRTFTMTDRCGNSTSCRQIIRFGTGIDLGPITDLAVLKATFSAFPNPDPGPGPVIAWEVFPVALVANLGVSATPPGTVLFRLTGFGAGALSSRSGSVGKLEPGQFSFVAAARDSRNQGIIVPPGDYVLQVVVRSVGIDKNVSNNVASVQVRLPNK